MKESFVVNPDRGLALQLDVIPTRDAGRPIFMFNIKIGDETVLRLDLDEAAQLGQMLVDTCAKLIPVEQGVKEALRERAATEAGARGCSVSK
jgi:hypothetical protein